MSHDLFRRQSPERAGALAPTLGSRLARFTRPHWTRTDTARRVAAAGLVVAAAVALVLDRRHDVGDPVVIASRDLTPGHLVSVDDVRLADRNASDIPAGSTRELAAVVGRTVSSPVRTGEIVTDVRVLGTPLAAAAAGTDDARIVPVRLSDAGLADMIRQGDRVDVLTVGTGRTVSTADDGASRAPAATVLASDATVVMVAPQQESGGGDRIVMLALPSTAASTVAAASLTDAITVTLH